MLFGKTLEELAEERKRKEEEASSLPVDEAEANLPSEKWFQKVRLDEVEQTN